MFYGVASNTLSGSTFGVSNGMANPALSFATVTDIRDTNIRVQPQVLLNNMNGWGLVDKNKALYPFVSDGYIHSRATQHKYNLMNPADTDAAFRIVWAGGITHNSNGVTGNGSTGYGNTKFTPNADGGSIYTQNSASFGVYTRTNEAGVYADMGNYIGGNGALSFRRRGGGNEFVGVNSAETVAGNTLADIRRLYLITRNDATNILDYRDGANISTYARASVALISVDYTIMAYNDNGTPIFYSPRNYAFAFIGGGLSSTDATNLTNAVNALQTSLSRNV